MINFVLVLLCFNTFNSALAVAVNNETWSCNGNFTNLKGQVVNLAKYCTDKPCLTKCCGENEIFRDFKGSVTCFEVPERLKGRLEEQNVSLNYSDLELYKSDIDTEVTFSTKNFLKDFNLVQKNAFLDANCILTSIVVESNNIFKILDNGKMAIDGQNLRFQRWELHEVSTFCVERVVRQIDKGVFKGSYSLFLLNTPETNTDEPQILNFLKAGLLISAFFLLLVLLVYCVLPQRRNLAGMILMAYMATIVVVYLMRVVHLLQTDNFSKDTCKVYSPILYFFILSSFLWLNIMCFDIWWKFRGLRYKRAINRQGEFVKFLWYCLYAWGVAAAMTTAAVLIDRANLTDWPRIIRPSFEACYGNHDPKLLYLYTPMGILTTINILLFLMTVYNFWLIRKDLNKVSGSSNNINNKMRYRMYHVLLMGLSWVLEVAQFFFEDFGLWLFVIVNLYNALIGVAIFFVLVFNMPTLNMLCQRFNIKIKFVEDWKSKDKEPPCLGHRQTKVSLRVPKTKGGAPKSLTKNWPKFLPTDVSVHATSMLRRVTKKRPCNRLRNSRHSPLLAATRMRDWITAFFNYNQCQCT